MLSVQQNEWLTRVGPGTPMGELFRRYWHPVAATVELKENPTKAVRILCEDLVLYRDRSGALGLIDESCPHRRVNLLYGIPEEKGLRCPYHGWLMDETGQCIEMPAEAPDSTFKDRVKVKAYPVQELGGLIWAYLGPAPVPLIPHWDVLVREKVFREVGQQVVDSNWLQIMENSMDPVHTEWLHGWYSKYVSDRRGEVGATARGVDSELYRKELEAGAIQPPASLQGVSTRDRWNVQARPGGGSEAAPRKHLRVGFDLFEYGLTKRRLLEGQTEEHEDWAVGHPLVFPLSLRLGNGNSPQIQIRVPLDDTHTWHLLYTAFDPGPGAELPQQEDVPMFEVPVYDKNTGWLVTDHGRGQDTMAWVTQGPVADRSVEKLAESDMGVIMYRRLLREQFRIMEDGGDPMNVFRDPTKNVQIDLPAEGRRNPLRPGWLKGYNHTRYSPRVDDWEKIFAQAAAARGGK